MKNIFAGFKKERYIDEWRSPFDMWISQNILCPIMGHKWVWWQLINRNKCRRCLEAQGLSVDESWRNGFAMRLSHYRKLQTPFWKLAGSKPNEEERTQEKYMSWRGYDYFDMQIERDKQGHAGFRKDLRRIENPRTAPKVVYEKK